MRYFLLSLIFCVSYCSAADLYPFHSEQKEKLFQQLTQELRCVVCQNENLSSSNATIAADLRQKIYMLLKNNHSSHFIKKYMTARYGNFVLLKPPFIQATFFLWIFPFVMLAAGIWVYFRAIRK